MLGDYEIVNAKPIYRAILQSIRQKIRGTADSALISYNIFDNDWGAIKSCLSLHYADKRDLRTLEHQLGSLTQGNKSVNEFYANVNHQLSLINNKVKTENYRADTMNVLSETYRNRALDVFIRGLNGEISKMLMIQRPQTLPEAYSSCLEIQNLNFRNLSVHNRNINNTVTIPINQMASTNRVYQNTPKPLPRLSLQQRNAGFNIHHQQHNTPPRPVQQKPPVPMDVDESIRTKNVNYMNRPNFNSGFKQEVSTDTEPHRKQQRIFNLEPQNETQYEEYIANYSDLDNSDEEREDDNEVNFMGKASLAYPT